MTSGGVLRVHLENAIIGCQLSLIANVLSLSRHELNEPSRHSIICPYVLSRPKSRHSSHLDHQSLHLVLQLSDLRHQVAGLVCGDGASDDCARDTAGSA